MNNNNNNGGRRAPTPFEIEKRREEARRRAANEAAAHADAELRALKKAEKKRKRQAEILHNKQKQPTRPQVPPQARPQVPPQARPQVPPQARPQVPPQARPQVPPQTRPQVPPQDRPQVPPQTRPQVPTQARPQVPTQARPQVPTQARPQVPTQKKRRKAPFAKTPRIRQAPPPSAPPETYEQRLAREAEQKRRAAELAKKRAAVRKKTLISVGSHLACGIMIFALLFGVIAGIFSLSARHVSKPKNYKITLSVSQTPGAKAKKTTVYSAQVFPNGSGEPYVCISDLAGMLGFAEIGNADTTRFVKGGEYIRLSAGASSVTVNGYTFLLTSPISRSDGKLWIPVEFFTRYTSGLDISYDKAKKTLSIAFARDEVNSDALHTKYLEFRLLPQAVAPIGKN